MRWHVLVKINACRLKVPAIFTETFWPGEVASCCPELLRSTCMARERAPTDRTIYIELNFAWGAFPGQWRNPPRPYTPSGNIARHGLPVSGTKPMATGTNQEGHVPKTPPPPRRKPRYDPRDVYSPKRRTGASKAKLETPSLCTDPMASGRPHDALPPHVHQERGAGTAQKRRPMAEMKGPCSQDPRLQYHCMGAGA